MKRNAKRPSVCYCGIAPLLKSLATNPKLKDRFYRNCQIVAYARGINSHKQLAGKAGMTYDALTGLLNGYPGRASLTRFKRFCGRLGVKNPSALFDRELAKEALPILENHNGAA